MCYLLNLILIASYWKDEKFVLNENKAKSCDVLITHSSPIWIGPHTKDGIEHLCEQDLTLWNELMEERNQHGKLIELCQPQYHYCGHFHKSMKATHNCTKSQILNIFEIIEHKNTRL